jgi:hypothetical protein
MPVPVGVSGSLRVPDLPDSTQPAMEAQAAVLRGKTISSNRDAHETERRQ